MIKIKKTLVRDTIYDKYIQSSLQGTKKMMFRLVFALARAVKITPKQLAESFTIKEVDEYAKDLNTELVKRVDKETEKIKSAIKKV